jgi:hypothetical protein
MYIVRNKGTGAGGAETNVSGLSFEMQTCNQMNLVKQGFSKVIMSKGKSTYYLKYSFDDLQVEIYYASKKGFTRLIQTLFDVSIFREPDEAYIIHYLVDDKYDVKIIEKKNQNTPGSVEDKLLAGNTIRKIYQKLLPNKCHVSYAFCISDYLKKNFTSDIVKYKVIREIFEEEGIPLFYGDDIDYFDKINKWIGL